MVDQRLIEHFANVVLEFGDGSTMQCDHTPLAKHFDEPVVVRELFNYEPNIFVGRNLGDLRLAVRLRRNLLVVLYYL
jgi:hypothetical protein